MQGAFTFLRDENSKIDQPIFSSKLLWGSKTHVWELHGCIVDGDGDGKTLAAGTFVITCKLLPKGKIPKYSCISSRLARQHVSHAEQG